MTARSLRLLLAGVAVAGCDRARPPVDLDEAVVLTTSEIPLVGEGVRRGTVTADSVIFDDDFSAARLIRPQLTVSVSPIRTQQLIIQADSGRLEADGARVLLFRPTRVSGARAAFTGRDSVWYSPAGDSVWAAGPAGG